jgi:hypothetical protein
MDIGQAVERLRANQRVVRAGWNGKGMWLAMMFPSKYSDATLPYVIMKTADDQFVPWLCSQTDLLATDWEVLE